MKAAPRPGWAPGLVALAALLLSPACGRSGAWEASQEGRNLLITLIDACAANRVGAYGHPRPTTPYLDRMAEESVLFERASSSAPYTLASIASLFTGEHADVHRVIHAGDPLPDSKALLAERFRANGYRTFGLSGNAHIHPRFGFDRGFERFEYIDPGVGRRPFHTVPPEMLETLWEELESADGRPFFGYVHFMPPHAPYDPPTELLRLFARDPPDARYGSIENLLPLSHAAREVPPREAQAILDLYDASLRHVDGVLAEVRARLERAGLLEDTVWIVLSDHGEAFGEHGLWQHSRLVVETMLHVPLIARFPGGRGAGMRIAAPVSLVDLEPTLGELFGLGPSSARTGVSLLPLLAGRQLSDRPPVVARTAGPGPHTSIRRGSKKAIYEARARRWSLFDLERDPLEQRDLSREQPELLAPLREELELWWERWRPAAGAPRQRVAIPPEMRERLAALGYLDVGEEDPEDGGEDPAENGSGD